jgi:alpha-glucosidase
MTDDLRWWQRGIVYQIYPRSFQDSNGDGVGDLNGIFARLDYVRALGVDAIWISPIYPSPMADHGYDVADYTGIEPIFGSMDDFNKLLAAAHARDLRVILDWVPNHTSDEHPWFVESRSTRDNDMRDWYIWQDAKPDGSPPNNWTSFFGGPAWEWDEQTQQYYLHLFHKKQPDLNWRNPDVKAAMFDVLRYWLDKGVDGFRMDVIGLIMKDEQFRDNPTVERQDPNTLNNIVEQQMVYNADLPEVHDVLREIRALFDEYDDDRVMIGEVFTTPLSRWVEYYGANNDEIHLPFNFGLMPLPWRAADFTASVLEMERELKPGNWPNYVLNNHDGPRIGTRFGPRTRRVAAMLLLTLRGTPTLYNGEELGMVDGYVPPDKIQDPQGLYYGPERSRDGCRTPLQWSDAPYAGFSTVEPWLPLADNYTDVNMTAQAQDARSMLALYRALTALRRRTPALYGGAFTLVETSSADVMAYLRTADDERLLVVLNFAAEEQYLNLEAVGARAAVLLSTEMDRDGELLLAGVTLRENEGLLLRVLG